MTAPDDRWLDAARAAEIFAIDPPALGGVCLRAAHGPARDRWVTYARSLVAEQAPWRRVPPNTPDSRLLGGLDLAATLAARCAIAERGLLAAAHRGVIVLPSAERVAEAMAAKIAASLDTGEVVTERDGITARAPARFGVLMLEEAASDEEGAPGSLRERMGIHLDLADVRPPKRERASRGARRIAAARKRVHAIALSETALTALATTASALGIDSIRPLLSAAWVARAAAALDGARAPTAMHLALAARLVLAPRATRLPSTAEPERNTPAPEPANGAAQPDQKPRSRRDSPALDDVVLAAAKAAVPPNLLALLATRGTRGTVRRGASRFGARCRSWQRGRPVGVRAAELRDGMRLNVLETLRAAAPWQRLRRQNRPAPARRARIAIRRSDFRVQCFERGRQSTTIFAVDASGSSAIHRLAEVKGAVELLLADCYVRRDQVALVAFRGTKAEVILPPTRSLVRAKRALAGLPGGGGTPLASGIDTARALGEAARRRGEAPLIVLLTDGRANVARHGGTDREAAAREAESAARELGASGLTALVVDTSPRANPALMQLAAAAAARYVPLPQADASGIVRVVQNA